MLARSEYNSDPIMSMLEGHVSSKGSPRLDPTSLPLLSVSDDSDTSCWLRSKRATAQIGPSEEMKGARSALPDSPTSTWPGRHVILLKGPPPGPPTSALQVSAAAESAHQENGSPIPHAHCFVSVKMVLTAPTTAPSDKRKPLKTRSVFLSPFDAAFAGSADIACSSLGRGGSI